jgi:hypothetical protein
MLRHRIGKEKAILVSRMAGNRRVILGDVYGNSAPILKHEMLELWRIQI